MSKKLDITDLEIQCQIDLAIEYFLLEMEV